MKKFTMFGLAIATIAACIGMIACTKDDATTPQEEPDFYTVKLGWGGEIVDIAYEPLDTRATTDDLYGIQGYSKPNNNSTATSWEPYAYGVFDDPTDISIDLASGNKYKFVATMVVDGKNKIGGSQVEADCYGYPFSDFPTTSVGLFIYNTSSNSAGLGDMSRGETSLKSGLYNIPNIERFYGQEENFVPSSNNTDLTISMKRVSFGAKFIAEGALAKSGTLDIQIEGAPKMSLALTEGDDTISDIFTLQGDGTDSGIEYCANDDYTETIGVAFKWIRPDGTELQIGTFPITFKRNTTTVVTINMENDVVEGDQTGGVGFSIANTEKSDMPVDEDNSVTITDGEVEGADDSAENE